ncbi:galectin-8 [Drosophila pseudoobscura]|uniref:Galectin n=1 Tax=Drosophila pseudoobscura pseudoobscura TaxID=46245 RepID=A0A6I8V527_DROPS|nr:galectin-8 [Drosophila pseudoobscura]
MNFLPGATTIALRRERDAMSMFYEKRTAANRRKHFKLLDPPRPGLSFFFHGLILSACEHFTIDFLTIKGKENCDHCDVLLQLGARLPQNYIVRNSRLMGKWGLEENSSPLRFQLRRGDTFWMQILLTVESFYISVNGYHFAEYAHRMPYRWLGAIDLRGDIDEIVIDKYYVTEYPIRLSQSVARALPFVYDSSLLKWVNEEATRMLQSWASLDNLSKLQRAARQVNTNLALPFYGRVPNHEKLIEGRAVRIEGRVRMMPQSFSVALQQGQQIWPQPTVSFYFSPSFLRKSRDKVGKVNITRSAYLNGSWVKRKVSHLHTSLRPGKAFVILIACRPNYYELFVNRKLLLGFKHQMNPECVDIVNIRGDVRLWDVVIETTRLGRPRSNQSIIQRAIRTLRQTHIE